jgi:DNA-directed RNA polymerase I subunit RPA49
VQRPAHSQHSEVVSEAGSVAGNDELKVQDLTMMYGTKADRDKVYLCRVLLVCCLRHVSKLISGVVFPLCASVCLSSSCELGF